MRIKVYCRWHHGLIAMEPGETPLENHYGGHD